jgi:flagellar assembly factor FliW
MLLHTKHFGKIEIAANNILRFESGIPGFELLKDFILLNNEDDNSPFKWLQCVNEPQMAFVVADPFAIVKDYTFNLPDEAVHELGIVHEKDVAVYSVVVVPDDTTKISVNLKAPIIINVKNKKAAQIILDTDKYTVRHYILDELRRQEVGADAGTYEKKGSVDHNK